ncbi:MULTISPECIES: hypothetical protein [Neisseria]|uniref:Uncharacterized protein n=1 Tax=Neisseria macacae ATCC 33926 TaxID=997348 RepID=A0AA36UIF1_9NEIS|nr:MULTISPECIES: hypothetical protein [Neisseria]EGQ76502.1 hypothetical protein HMPREF9418_1860 [Neisseria macacae ATCC 33926]UNV83858.1 hypothetical protein MON40_07400 [Neisseria macacae ATCC 33926]
MLNQIQLKRYAELSGYTEKALRDKISTGVWVEGLHYYRAPDRHILINVKEVENGNETNTNRCSYPRSQYQNMVHVSG